MTVRTHVISHYANQYLIQKYHRSNRFTYVDFIWRSQTVCLMDTMISTLEECEIHKCTIQENLEALALAERWILGEENDLTRVFDEYGEHMREAVDRRKAIESSQETNA